MPKKIEKIVWSSLLEPVVDPATGIVDYRPLLRVEPDPAGETEGKEPKPPTETTPVSKGLEITLPDGTKEFIDNPAGLYSTFNKYKQLGSVDHLAKTIEDYERSNRLLQSIQEQGVQPSDIPNLLQKMKEEDERRAAHEAEIKKQVETEIASIKTEHQKILADVKAEAMTERALRVKTEQDFFVKSRFAVNAQDEFRNEFDTWWAPLRSYVDFEPREDPTQPIQVARIKGPDGSTLLAEDSKGQTREATINDFFDAIVEGKYGSIAKAALKPFTTASGGGSLNPATADYTGKLRIPANFDYASATPEQLSKIKAGDYIQIT